MNTQERYHCYAVILFLSSHCTLQNRCTKLGSTGHKSGHVTYKCQVPVLQLSDPPGICKELVRSWLLQNCICCIAKGWFLPPRIVYASSANFQWQRNSETASALPPLDFRKCFGTELLSQLLSSRSYSLMVLEQIWEHGRMYFSYSLTGVQRRTR